MESATVQKQDGTIHGIASTHSFAYKSYVCLYEVGSLFIPSHQVGIPLETDGF